MGEEGVQRSGWFANRPSGTRLGRACTGQVLDSSRSLGMTVKRGRKFDS